MKTCFQPGRLVREAKLPIGCGRGFSLIELLLGMGILSVALLAIATMFSTGYTDVTVGGNTTMAVAAGRQIVEDMRLLPFARLDDLNGFNTSTLATLPPVPATNDPDKDAKQAARDIARKWHYALTGEGGGWTYTTAEKLNWSTLQSGYAPTTMLPTADQSSSLTYGGTGQIQVLNEGGSTSLKRVTITVTVPGRLGSVLKTVQFVTLISRL
jgi:prepilin-type N-terminal cleavage/methylation domain-containing protein